MEEKKQQKETKEQQKKERLEKRKRNLIEKQTKVVQIKKSKRQLFSNKCKSKSVAKESSDEEPIYVETDDEDSADEDCIFCTEPYKNDSKGENWIKCIKCSSWAHELCAGTEDWKTFTCDFCNTKD